MEIIIDYLKDRQPGKAYSYAEFSQALYNTYLAKGMTERKAKNLLERTLELNKKRALHCFDENAENCFVTERIQEYNI